MKKSNISDESKALHKLYRDGEIDDQTLEDSMTGLALLPPQETAIDVFTRPCGLDPYLDNVRDKIAEFKANPPPLNTEKGRAQYRSMARKVASFKTAMDEMGKNLNDELKEKPKKVDAERKRMRELLDAWRDDVRQPADDYEAEQKRLEDIRLAEEAAKALLIQIESDHEIGILLNEKYDRELAEVVKKAEEDRLAYEAKIAAGAAENARIAAEQAAANAIRDAQLATERAQREKAESEAREKQALIDAQAREVAQKEAAEIATKQAAERAEQQRLKAIADTEARIAREKAAEDAAIAKQAANKAHQKRISNEAKDDLIALGFSEEAAINLIKSIVNGKVRNISINY
jgi:hypothetical protein